MSRRPDPLHVLLCVATVIASLASAPASPAHPRDRSFGTLFHTPAQRHAAEAPRPSRVRTAAGAVGHPDSARAGEAATVELNGIVMDSEGRQTAWLNGTMADATMSPRRVLGMQAAPPGALLAVPGTQGEVFLRVGQRLDTSSGRIDEAYAWHKPAEAGEPAPQPSVRAHLPAPPSARAARPSLHLHVHTGPVRQRRKAARDEEER